jgi:hypothetical protein
METIMSNDIVQKLLDIHQIQQLLVKYTIAIDTRDFDLLERCFTADAELHLAGLGTMTPQAYRKVCEQNLPSLDATQHHCGIPAIEFGGDVAHSRCYFMAQHARNSLGAAPLMLIGGWYDDVMHRVGDDWRIHRRTGTAAWYEGNGDVLGYPVPQGGLAATPGRARPGWLK